MLRWLLDPWLGDASPFITLYGAVAAAVLILLRAEGDSGLFRHATDILGRQLSHLIRLVDDLLDVSRISRDKLHLRKTRVDLGSIITDALEASRSLDEVSVEAFQSAAQLLHNPVGPVRFQPPCNTP